MRAADAAVRYLEAEGLRYVFGNPGTTEVPFVDALVGRGVEFVLCLQENVAVAAADGLAQATRRAQAVNLHTGPGVAQAYSAIYMAAKHRSPVVITAGNEDTRFALTEPLLRADLVAMARPVVKWAHEVSSPDEVIPTLRRAFKVAQTPPTGPVLLSWPMDVLAREVPDDLDLSPATVPAGPAPDAGAVERVAALVASARSPCFVAGDDVGRTRSDAALAALAEAVGAKVYGAPLHQLQPIPNTHPLWGGALPPFPALCRALLGSHDVIVVLGARAFWLYYYQPVDPVPPEAVLVHVHPDGWEISKNYPAQVGIVATADRFVAALSDAVRDWPPEAVERAAQRLEALAAQGREARAGTEAWARQEASRVPLTPPGIMHLVCEVLGDRPWALVDESITSSFAARQIPPLESSEAFFGHKGGALSWGAGAALGVALADRSRRVVCTVGDGSLLYCPQAIWTAARLRLPILYVVFNNGGYAIIKSATRAQKQRAYQTGIYPGMDITDPDVDFVSLARGLGAGGARAERPGELRKALEEAVQADGPYLVDCVLERAIPELPF